MPISFFSVGETISTVLSSTMFMNWSYPAGLQSDHFTAGGQWTAAFEASQHAHHVSVGRKLEILSAEVRGWMSHDLCPIQVSQSIDVFNLLLALICPDLNRLFC